MLLLTNQSTLVASYDYCLFVICMIMQELFADPDNREFFISVGRDLISRLLLNAEKVSFVLLIKNCSLNLQCELL